MKKKYQYKHVNLPLVAHAQLKALSVKYATPMTNVLIKLIEDEYNSL